MFYVDPYHHDKQVYFQDMGYKNNTTLDILTIYRDLFTIKRNKSPQPLPQKIVSSDTLHSTQCIQSINKLNSIKSI